jgi:hypothetical protein
MLLALCVGLRKRSRPLKLVDAAALAAVAAGFNVVHYHPVRLEHE